MPQLLENSFWKPGFIEPQGPLLRQGYEGQAGVGGGAKWMSADGKTIHLVFSGDDAFSVRRLEVLQR